MLALRGISKDAVYLLPMYEEGNVAKDAAAWFYDALGGQALVQEIIAKYETNINLLSDNDKNEPKTAVLYSGSFNPFMMALDKRHDFNVDTIITLGGPSFNGTIFQGENTNPNLKKIYNIYGSEDGVPLARKNKSFSNIEVINIKILGATHFDYFYDANRGLINDKSSKFVEDLTKATLDHDEVMITNLLHEKGTTYDIKTKTYIIDISDSSFDRHDR